MAESEFVKVAQTGDLSPGEMKSVSLGDEDVLLANVNGNFYVISDTCTHAMGPLYECEVDEDEVQCRVHGAKFGGVTGGV